MELKNEFPNGCNVVTNNLHPMILLYFKNIDNWVRKRTSKFILGLVRFYSCLQTKSLKLIAFILLIKIERFKAFYVYIDIVNQVQILYFLEKWFWKAAWGAIKITYYTINF